MLCILPIASDDKDTDPKFKEHMTAMEDFVKNLEEDELLNSMAGRKIEFGSNKGQVLLSYIHAPGFSNYLAKVYGYSVNQGDVIVLGDPSEEQYIVLSKVSKEELERGMAMLFDANAKWIRVGGIFKACFNFNAFSSPIANTVFGLDFIHVRTELH